MTDSISAAAPLAPAPLPDRGRLALDDSDSRFVRRIGIVIVLIALSAALYRMSDLLILAFGAILGAIAIHAIADLYRGWLRLKPPLALGAGIVTVLALLAFLFWLFGIQFGQQVNSLVTQLPSLLAQLSHWLSQSPMGAKLVSAVNSAYAGSKVARDLSGVVLGGGELVLNFLLLLVGSLFFAADPGVYERGFLLIPPSRRGAVEDALFDAAATLKLWLRAQLIQMTTMGVLIGLGLWIAGVPSAAALGLLAGLSEFIPYVGPTAAMLPALGLAATAGTGPILGTLATYALVRMVQSNFITPFVTNRVISIPPAVTLFAILGIGAVFGVFGLFFSAALLVVIFTLVRTLYLREVLGEAIPHAERASGLGTN